MQFPYVQYYKSATFFIKNALKKNRWEVQDLHINSSV